MALFQKKARYAGGGPGAGLFTKLEKGPKQQPTGGLQGKEVSSVHLVPARYSSHGEERPGKECDKARPTLLGPPRPHYVAKEEGALLGRPWCVEGAD